MPPDIPALMHELREYLILVDTSERQSINLSYFATLSVLLVHFRLVFEPEI